MARFLAGGTAFALLAAVLAVGADETPATPSEPGAPALTLETLEVFPTSIEIHGIRDARKLLVTGRLPNGDAADLTDAAALRVEGDAVYLDADRYVAPKQVGEATVVVEAAGKSVRVPVVVKNADPAPVSFIREIEPLLSKVGCNAGTCHGSQQGKAGFKLSLRGYDPEFDYNALVDDIAGRRFNRANPEQSLMLLKPTQGVPHEGGFLFDEDSRAYALIRQWIAEGCQYDGAERVASVEVFPQDVLLPRSRRTQSQIVIARYADGTTRDVTRDVCFETSNFEIATVDAAGRVTGVRRGECAVLIRYEGQYATNVVTVLAQREGFAWRQPAEYNRIDELVNQKLRRMQILPSDLCSDGEFLRRIHFDLTGLPPTAEEVRAFLEDPRDSRTKREAKIEELLASAGYVDHWTLKWSDLLLSNRKFITEKGVWAFRNWIRQAIQSNMPYDKFVRALITANGSSFENPAANYYRIAREPRIVMENMTQVFLGTRFMCANCHDHPFERWTQSQYHELSGFFASVGRKPGTVEGDEVIFPLGAPIPLPHPKSGQPIAAGLPFHHAGEDPAASDLREQVAAWLVAKENPYFARSIVNRYWSYFFGRGLIDPVDDIRSGNPPTNAALLDWLTEDFIAHEFDLKHLIRQIVSSQTYQRSIVTNAFNADDVLYASHAVPRRLTAEQLYDAIMTATGSPSSIPGVPSGFRATQLPDSKVDLSFLDLFGRPPRESPCECERTSEVSLSQTLNLINGPTIGDAVSHPQSRVARLIRDEKVDDSRLVDEIYLSVLCRFPTDEERQQGIRYIAEVGNRLEAAQDLVWALINSPAFLFNR